MHPYFMKKFCLGIIFVSMFVFKMSINTKFPLTRNVLIYDITINEHLDSDPHEFCHLSFSISGDKFTDQ